MNRLHYGDNLEVLRDRSYFPDGCVDLIYLDPPFNSNRSYNVLFKQKSGQESQAQIEAFDDTWTWSQESEQAYYDLLTHGSPKVADAIEAMRKLLGENDVLAYLTMMSVRLVELHRVLKPTGTMYLHCDPTASHYLKVLLDALFGPTQFRSEIIWKRSSAHNSAKRWGPVHDVILMYTRSDKFTWNEVYEPLPERTAELWYNNVESGTGRRFNRADLTGAGVRTGSSAVVWRGINPTSKGRHWAIPRFVGDIVAGLDTAEALDALDAAGRLHWPKSESGVPMLKRYLDESKGVPAQDVITDIDPLKNNVAERLGYPTQKPVELLSRLVAASSKPGDVVLDPFCGCGTAIDAAQRLERAWLGIDVTFLAVDLIDTRLRDTFGSEIIGSYEVVGIPRDTEGAAALFARNPFDFERWAVSLVDGTPNEKQVGDKGSDGVIRFPLDTKKATGKAVVSVKGGVALNPGMVRELVGTVDQTKANMGIFICNTKPTPGMVEVAHKSGDYAWPVDGRKFPRIQLITVADLLNGKRPYMPTPFLPYLQAQRLVDDNQLTFGV